MLRSFPRAQKGYKTKVSYSVTKMVKNDETTILWKICVGTGFCGLKDIFHISFVMERRKIVNMRSFGTAIKAAATLILYVNVEYRNEAQQRY